MYRLDKYYERVIVKYLKYLNIVNSNLCYIYGSIYVALFTLISIYENYAFLGYFQIISSF